MSCNYNIIKNLEYSSKQSYIKELNYKYAYLTIEDLSDSDTICNVVDDLIDGDYYSQISCIESNDSYFVVKIEYDNWEDVKDVCATISQLLLEYSIGTFTVSCKAEELLNEYDS